MGRQAETGQSVLVALIALLVIGAAFYVFVLPHLRVAITPPTTEELMTLAVANVNAERSSRGLINVTLNHITSTQAHADDMLAHGFLSH